MTGLYSGLYERHCKCGRALRSGRDILSGLGILIYCWIARFELTYHSFMNITCSTHEYHLSSLAMTN